MITIIVVGIAFTAAQIGLGYMVWKYRDTGNSAIARFTRTAATGWKLSGPMITAVIFIGLGGDGTERLGVASFQRCARRARTQVEVVAQQFQWNFHYAGKDNVFGRTDPNLIDDSCAELHRP